jgi:hypothetical protein
VGVWPARLTYAPFRSAKAKGVLCVARVIENATVAELPERLLNVISA